MSYKKFGNIFLIGPMGAGKSSVGKHLAKMLSMQFYDTDEEIEKSTGASIGWIFDLEGEEGFRKRESKIIADLTELSDIVLATGGGSILEESNRKLLKDRGHVIYLTVSLENQETRTLNESRRPLLSVKNRTEVLEQFHHERTPLYQSIAELELKTDKRSIVSVTDDILEWLEKHDGFNDRE